MNNIVMTDGKRVVYVLLFRRIYLRRINASLIYSVGAGGTLLLFAHVSDHRLKNSLWKLFSCDALHK